MYKVYKNQSDDKKKKKSLETVLQNIWKRSEISQESRTSHYEWNACKNVPLMMFFSKI